MRKKSILCVISQARSSPESIHAAGQDFSCSVLFCLWTTSEFFSKSFSHFSGTEPTPAASFYAACLLLQKPSPPQWLSSSNPKPCCRPHAHYHLWFLQESAACLGLKQYQVQVASAQSPDPYGENTKRSSLVCGVCLWCALTFSSTKALRKLWNKHSGGRDWGGINAFVAPALSRFRWISPQHRQESSTQCWFFQAFLQCVYVVLRHKRALLPTWPVALHCTSFLLLNTRSCCYKQPQVLSGCSLASCSILQGLKISTGVFALHAITLHLPRGTRCEWLKGREATEEVRGNTAGNLVWERGVWRRIR